MEAKTYPFLEILNVNSGSTLYEIRSLQVFDIIVRNSVTCSFEHKLVVGILWCLVNLIGSPNTSIPWISISFTSRPFLCVDISAYAILHILRILIIRQRRGCTRCNEISRRVWQMVTRNDTIAVQWFEPFVIIKCRRLGTLHCCLIIFDHVGRFLRDRYISVVATKMARLIVRSWNWVVRFEFVQVYSSMKFWRADAMSVLWEKNGYDYVLKVSSNPQ